MGLITIGGAIASQPLNDNFSYINQKLNFMVYNATDYGVIGNGAVDDTASLQASLNAANTAGGGIVEFSGTPLISSPLTIYANTTFGGHGPQDKLIISPSFLADAFTPGITMAINAPLGGTASGIKLENFTIDGTGSAVVGVCGFLTNGTSTNEPTIQAELRNVNFTSLTGRGLLAWSQSFIKAYNCKATNCNGDGGFRSTQQTVGKENQIILINCEASGCAQAGFYLEGAKFGLLVGCKGYNNTAGATAGNGIFIVDNCHLEGCETYGNSNAGIYATGSNNTITDCLTHNNALGCDIYHGSVVQKNNKVINGTSYSNAIVGIGGGFSGQNQNGLMIINCTSYNNGNITFASDGFHYDDCTNLLIQGNKAYDDRTPKYQPYGVRILSGCSTIRIFDNTFSANLTGPINIATAVATTTFIRDNVGYNPVGYFTSQPSVPASTTPYTNNFMVRSQIYIWSGTVTAIAISSNATGLTSGTFLLDPGDSITLTYSLAPLWQWFGL